MPAFEHLERHRHPGVGQRIRELFGLGNGSPLIKPPVQQKGFRPDF